MFRKLTVEDNIQAVLEAQQLSREERPGADRAADREAESGQRASNAGLCAERRRAPEGGDRAVPGDRALRSILLDEPFSGIDPIAVLELQEIIFDLKMNGMRRSDHRPQCA